MYFRIAETLGMPVKKLLEEITSSEITEWHAYFNIQEKQMKQPGKERELLEKAKKAHG